MRYRAFLSYSHQDTRVVTRLHAMLERWRVDKALVGRDTRVGPVPPNLRPIFRDRDDFSSGASLADATYRALEASEFLLVACSPAAARSAYVNEEIRLFRALGRSDRVIPIILSGEPGDRQQECFPEAIRFGTDADGTPTGRALEPIAADARDQGDGFHRATAKVAAALLGLPFDEIAKRAERAQRRRMRIVAAVAVGMFALAITAGALAWYADQKRAEAERNAATARSAADSVLTDIALQLAAMPSVDLATIDRIFTSTNEVYGRLLSEQPDAVELLERRAAMLSAFALTQLRRGDNKAAEESSRKSLALMESLLDTTQNTRGIKVQIARTRMGLALTVRSHDRPEAIRILKRAVETLDRLDARAPLDVDSQVSRVDALVESGSLTLESDDTVATGITAQRALALAQRIYREAPESFQGHARLGRAWFLKAELDAALGDAARATRSARAAIAHVQVTLDLDPYREDFRHVLVQAYQTSAGALEQAGDYRGRELALWRAEGYKSNRVAYAEANAEEISYAAAAAYAEAKYNRNAQELERAAELAREAVGLRERVRDMQPETIMAGYLYAEALALLARTLSDLGDNQGALAVALEEAAVLRPIADQDAYRTLHIAMTLARIAIARQALGDCRRAFADLLESQRLLVTAAHKEARQVDALDRYGGLLSHQLECVRELGTSPEITDALRETHSLWTDLAAGDPDRRAGLAMVSFHLGQGGDKPTSRWREAVELLEAVAAERPLSPEESKVLQQARMALRSN